MTFTNHKGGVGKTAICYNIAHILEALGLSVLCVDMDPQRNLTMRFDKIIDDKEEALGIESILLDDNVSVAEISDVVINIKGDLDLIPASPLLSTAEYDLKNTIGGHLQLKNILSKVKDVYDYILIDTPPALSGLTYNAIVASDSVVVIIEPSESSLTGIDSITNIVRSVNKKLGIPVVIEGIVFNKFDKRSNNPKHVMERLTTEEQFKDLKMLGIIPSSADLGRCDLMRAPIVVLAPQANAAQAMRDLVEVLR